MSAAETPPGSGPLPIRQLAREYGFELAGVAAPLPAPDYDRYRAWVDAGQAGAMGYLRDHRADLRSDPRLLLPSVRSIVCVGKLYNTPAPEAPAFTPEERGWISRYAWGEDYHLVLRRDLERLAARLSPDHEYRVCVDTAPLLERSYAHRAGLGWIGKNTCLINEPAGSWFFLGELLTSLELPPDEPPPDRCGSCTRCIDACPTAAIAPGGYELDARLCISYFTIELRGPVPEDMRAPIGAHVFGCDICQDVCPWNRRAPFTAEAAFAPQHASPHLERLAAITEDEFRTMFRSSPVNRARYRGFLRNVALALGNSRNPAVAPVLERLATHSDPVVRDHAAWALEQIRAHATGQLQPSSGPILIVDYNPQWPELFRREADRVRAVLGSSALRIEHTGSTSVPGLAAKPVIDMLLVVNDSADENAYAPALERAGYVLRIREVNWHEHRMFKGPDTDINVHVFSAGCPEIDRILLFRDSLRSNAADRDLYARAKRALSQKEWKSVQNYANAKTAVIGEIIERASLDSK